MKRTEFCTYIERQVSLSDSHFIRPYLTSMRYVYTVLCVYMDSFPMKFISRNSIHSNTKNETWMQRSFSYHYLIFPFQFKQSGFILAITFSQGTLTLTLCHLIMQSSPSLRCRFLLFFSSFSIVSVVCGRTKAQTWILCLGANANKYIRRNSFWRVNTLHCIHELCICVCFWLTMAYAHSLYTKKKSLNFPFAQNEPNERTLARSIVSAWIFSCHILSFCDLVAKHQPNMYVIEKHIVDYQTIHENSWR